MTMSKSSLIPRYNWDYLFVDFLKAAAASLKERSYDSESFALIFGSNPIYTMSGRASLYTILKALNLTEGSKVGVPLFCCPVVFEAIIQARLLPMFMDIQADDYNISAVDIEKKRKELSAVIVPHMFGFPADMDAIHEVCGNIPIIEDCAHSLFSMYNSKYTGTLSTASFFSFRSGKYISAGEGSAIIAQDKSLSDKIKGIVSTYQKKKVHQEILHCASTYVKSKLYNRPLYGTAGYPIGRRLDQKLNLSDKTGFTTGRIAKSDLEILYDRLPDFQKKIEKQRENSLFLLKKINLNLNNILLPIEKSYCRSNYYQFVLKFQCTEHRDMMADYLFRSGIDSAKYLDDITISARNLYGYRGGCITAELCSKRVLAIPNHYTLSKEDLDHIASTLNKGKQLLLSKTERHFPVSFAMKQWN
ncbi:MAG: DegT/DnrJ/EryC1/StrS family aminotransferase [Desulfatirhabdiaceae bacterium]